MKYLYPTLFWIGMILALVDSFPIALLGVGIAIGSLNRANRVTKYSEQYKGRYDDAGFPARSYQGGVK